MRLLSRAFGGVMRNGVLFLPCKNGMTKVYPDGTTHFISNSWYSDIDTDQL